MKKPSSDKIIYVAMSGGVDSSVAALLLKNKGYDVVGVFMKYWMDSASGAPSFAESSAGRENRCCSLEARQDAMRVCAHLGIPFLTWDFQKEFKKAVVDDFIFGYKKGITPNPCVVCNKNIKLGLFLKKALKDGAPACRQAGIFVATGHYARLRREFPISKSQFSNKNKNSKSRIIYKLCQAKDDKKDQSYFLYNLKQEHLRHILFPLGNLIKDEVREIAKKAGIPVALKKDSQEVCFVKDGNLKEFLKENMPMEKGDIVLASGKKVGEHEGSQFYTIGQRAPIGGTGPYYVIGKNIKKNQLIVAKGEDKELFIEEISVKNVNWISGKTPKLPFECQVKTRYQQQSQKAAIVEARSKKKSLILFTMPQRAITPGQSAVFYKKKEIIGGGIIC